MKIKEYNLRWFKLTYNTIWSGFLVYFGYKIIYAALLGFETAATQQERLTWAVLIGLICFAVKFRFPRFDNFYQLKRCYCDDDD